MIGRKGVIGKFNCDRLFPTLPTAYGNSLSYYEELEKIACKVNEIIEFLDGDFESKIDELIEKYFNQIMIDATYDESTETIVLKKEIISTGDYHIYHDDTKTIEVV